MLETYDNSDASPNKVELHSELQDAIKKKEQLFPEVSQLSLIYLVRYRYTKIYLSPHYIFLYIFLNSHYRYN